jgi:hypothetical protein
LVKISFDIYYEVAFVIAPVIGQVTLAVDNSPTAPFRGVHSETTAVNVYVGFVVVAAPADATG